MTIPSPVAAWLFNKNLGESAGQYKDSIGGLILASYDGLDHPAVSPKVGAGAYQGNNTLSRRLSLVSFDGPHADAGYTVSVWWRAAALLLATDRIVDYFGVPIASLTYSRTVSSQTVQWYGCAAQAVFPQDTAWHHSLLVVGESYETEIDGETVVVRDATPYLDGVAGTTMQVDDMDAYSSGALYLCGYSAYWNGDVDALHFWRVTLTPEQIAEVYNSGAGWEYTPPAPFHVVLQITSGPMAGKYTGYLVSE